MALRDLVPAIPASCRLHWLLNCAGKEANWFWKWKFVLRSHVRFDQTNMAAMVPDTSAGCSHRISILALNQILALAVSGTKPFRVNRGVAMLMDRVCLAEDGMQ